MCGGCIWLLSGPEGGVRLSNDMEEYAVEYLDKHQVLNSTEQVVAYYDATITVDGTEAAILTTERVLYHMNGKTTAIPISEITDIRVREDDLMEYLIEIDSRDGMPMKIELAYFNQGETFVNALENAWTNSQE